MEFSRWQAEGAAPGRAFEMIPRRGGRGSSPLKPPSPFRARFEKTTISGGGAFGSPPAKFRRRLRRASLLMLNAQQNKLGQHHCQTHR